jgi:hypothetical protein
VIFGDEQTSFNDYWVLIAHGPELADGVPFEPLPANRLSPAEQILPPAGLIPMLLLKKVLFIVRTNPADTLMPNPLLAKRTLSTFACELALDTASPASFSEKSESRALSTTPLPTKTPKVQFCSRT